MRNRIRYDASRFAVVEVDATFYGLPIAATSQRWMERTPDDARVRYQGSTLQPSETKRLREAVF